MNSFFDDTFRLAALAGVIDPVIKLLAVPVVILQGEDVSKKPPVSSTDHELDYHYLAQVFLQNAGGFWMARFVD